jgi:uncharacterized protein
LFCYRKQEIDNDFPYGILYVFGTNLCLRNLGLNQHLFTRGVELFNRSEFYEAHEVLEDVWRSESGSHKLFVQGLIQVAVALHHYSTGNLVGARSLLGRAARNLSSYPNEYFHLNLARFRESLSAWQDALDQKRPVPPFPRLEIIGQDLIC